MADSNIAMRDGERREGVKRRFTEEKDDKLPENLLGYQVHVDGLPTFIQIFQMEICVQNG